MKKIVVNGTFDILHVGHIKLLEYAKSLGDHLTVAIDTDRRIKTLKGDKRPINNAYERATMLRALKSVDVVAIFDADQELLDLISECDIMVKGSDYRGVPVIGEQHIKVIYYERIEEYSTTKKIQSIVDR